MSDYRMDVRHQDRGSLALKAAPGGLQLLVPRQLPLDGARVERFVAHGLEKIERAKQKYVGAPRLSETQVRGLVDEWAERLSVQVNRVQIRPMRSKWGSCSSRGNMTLSRELTELPRPLVEYVVCHELLHLRIPQHGAGFNVLLNSYIPDWKSRELALAAYSIPSV